MKHRVIEVCSDNRYLNLHRGFLRVTCLGDEIGRVALDDIGALILNGYGLSYSNDLIVELAERNIPVVVCGSNHYPVSWLWPIDGHSLQAKRMDQQIASSAPKSKQLWKQLVVCKVQNQAYVLDQIGEPSTNLKRLSENVRSGDPSNIEAQAARKYWRLLFGPDFRRDRNEAGINSMLNYGYTIMRSAVARAVMSAGLHPTVPIHHKNKYNPFRLVDDLIEPFRPLVDWLVYDLYREGCHEIDTEVKSRLAQIVLMQSLTKEGRESVRRQTLWDRLTLFLRDTFLPVASPV